MARVVNRQIPPEVKAVHRRIMRTRRVAEKLYGHAPEADMQAVAQMLVTAKARADGEAGLLWRMAPVITARWSVDAALRVLRQYDPTIRRDNGTIVSDLLTPKKSVNGAVLDQPVRRPKSKPPFGLGLDDGRVHLNNKQQLLTVDMTDAPGNKAWQFAANRTRKRTGKNAVRTVERFGRTTVWSLPNAYMSIMISPELHLLGRLTKASRHGFRVIELGTNGAEPLILEWAGGSRNEMTQRQRLTHTFRDGEQRQVTIHIREARILLNLPNDVKEVRWSIEDRGF
jgi:hypothetical protein